MSEENLRPSKRIIKHHHDKKKFDPPSELRDELLRLRELGKYINKILADNTGQNDGRQGLIDLPNMAKHIWPMEIFMPS